MAGRTAGGGNERRDGAFGSKLSGARRAPAGQCCHRAGGGAGGEGGQAKNGGRLVQVSLGEGAAQGGGDHESRRKWVLCASRGGGSQTGETGGKLKAAGGRREKQGVGTAEKIVVHRVRGGSQHSTAQWQAFVGAAGQALQTCSAAGKTALRGEYTAGACGAALQVCSQL